MKTPGSIAHEATYCAGVISHTEACDRLTAEISALMNEAIKLNKSYASNRERLRIRRAQRKALDELRVELHGCGADHLLDAIDNATKAPRRKR